MTENLVRRKYQGKVNNFILPILGCVSAKAITIYITYPLQNILVRVQGSKSKKMNLKTLNRKSLFKGLTSTFMMETVYTSLFWLPYHNLYNKIKENYFDGGEGKGPAIATGIISGTIAVCCSHPFDVVRTVKIVDNGKLGDLGNFKLIKTIFEMKGISGVFSGKILNNFFDFFLKDSEPNLSEAWPG